MDTSFNTFFRFRWLTFKATSSPIMVIAITLAALIEGVALISIFVK